MSNPRPTVGSRVLYSKGKKILPAVVTNVYDENCVNLQVFNDDESGCEYVKGAILGFQDHQWSWPTEVATQDNTTPTNPPPPRP